MVTKADLVTGAVLGGTVITTSFIDSTYVFGISIASWCIMTAGVWTGILILKSVGVFFLVKKAGSLIKKLFKR